MKITNPGKSVVGGIRYRGKIGFDVALQALRECMRQRRCSKAELLKPTTGFNSIWVAELTVKIIGRQHVRILRTGKR